MKYIPKDKTIIEVARVFPALCRKNKQYAYTYVLSNKVLRHRFLTRNRQITLIISGAKKEIYFYTIKKTKLVCTYLKDILIKLISN